MVTSTEDDVLKSSNCVTDNAMIVNKTRLSKRPKKMQVTRSSDFFMVNQSIKINSVSTMNNINNIFHQDI
jgi:hypothetical protein